MRLFHAAHVVRALAIMLRGFHDRRDAASHPFGHGVYFQVDPEHADGTAGIELTVDDADALRPFAVSFWPERPPRGSRGCFYLLPADVANCYQPRMVAEVTSIDPLREG